MGKRQPTYRIEFTGPGYVFENVRVVIVDKGPEDLNWFHIDKKQNGWLLLVTEGFLHENDVFMSIDIVRQQGERVKPNFLVRDGCACPIRIYTVLTTFHGKEFYHVDQLDDGNYRLAHTTKMFGRDFDHMAVNQITFTPE